MTKARARQRAKAKAAQKIKKRQANADRTEKTIPHGQFDPGSGSIKGPRGNPTATFGKARRGPARGG